MRPSPFTLLITLTACGGLAPEDANSPNVQWPASPWGITHVASSYRTGAEAHDALNAGAELIEELGVSAIKVYLTPRYATDYPGAVTTPVGSLVELASTAPYEALFERPFELFTVTTYTFAMGIGDPWREQVSEPLLAAVREEMRELTEHLLTTYAGSGKRFVLQTWEGDWALFGAFDPTVEVSAARTQRMVRWLEARQQGVDDARRNVGSVGVEVLHAAEINRVLDADGERRRVLTHVLPSLQLDAVSYSAWDALEEAVHHSPFTAESYRSALRTALDKVRDVIGDTPLILGEVGYPERELSVPVGELMQVAADEAAATQVKALMYWQLWENDCDRGVDSCRGLWVVRPDGTPGAAAEVLAR